MNWDNYRYPTLADFKRLEAKLDRALALLSEIKQKEIVMQADLTALTQAVSDEATVEKSAVVLLDGLTKKINDLIANSGTTVDPAELQKLADQITQSKADLATAVTRNTPAA